MGKHNFPRIYVEGCRELGTDKMTMKLSTFCSEYDPKKNYAGIAVYHHGGSYKWKNKKGMAKGYNCRGIYILILCTDDWPVGAFKRAGQGLVHDFLYRQMFGVSYSEKMTCCGGFSIMKGHIKYSSIWLNRQASARTNKHWETDGDKNLSGEEQILVDLAVAEWMRGRKGQIVTIPDTIDAVFRIAALAM